MSAPGRSEAFIPEREVRRVVPSARRATPGTLIPACEARRIVL